MERLPERPSPAAGKKTFGIIPVPKQRIDEHLARDGRAAPRAGHEGADRREVGTWRHSPWRAN